LLLAEQAKRSREKRARRPRVRLDPSDFQDERPPEAPRRHVPRPQHGPPVRDLYYKKARYKVYWGGRGSAKSWAIAEALIRLTASMPLRVLCLREFQNSIKESSHKILSDTITRLGMQAWFDITDTSIKSRVGGGVHVQGLLQQAELLRSTEGVDICWLEEAHTISEASWRVIIPTIRKDGSEIWVSFNMDDEMDATYRRLVANRRPDAIVHKVNYDQNPYFPETLRAEMEYDKATDYHLYEHIWLGMPRKVSQRHRAVWQVPRGARGRIRLRRLA
jgi:phage terminase large subunit